MYTIGQVAEMFGLPISTLRYYDKEGLFPDLVRTSGIRRFGERELEALRVIECLKRSGLEIKDIKQFMQWCGEGSSTYPQRRELFLRQKQTVEAEIARMDARISLTSQITEARHPDLELTDIYGKKIRLSSLAGKVVLLDFWSAELGSSNALNADLKELYRKYADAPVGFEVYQVAVDTSKPLWITAVQEQQLPWISVSDLRGRSSVALGLYNVQRLPANFLIDKEGTIVAKNIYGKSLEAKLDELTK